MPRQRLTRRAEQAKKASPPPQMPAVDRTEGPASPAYYPDPEQDKYEKGDTSAWAEDPHKPMEQESSPPAMPGNLTTEDLDHPGTAEFQKKPVTPDAGNDKGGGGAKAASEQPSLRKMAEARAALALRIAGALMPTASALEIEQKAVDLMDIDDDQLRATAATLNIFASDEEEEMEDEGDPKGDEHPFVDKEASHQITARLDRLENSFGRLVKAMSSFFGMDDDTDPDLLAYLESQGEDLDGDGIDQSKNTYPQDYDIEKMSEGETEEEAELFMEDEGPGEEEDEEEAMLRAMLEEMDEEMAMTASDKKEASEKKKAATAPEEAVDALAKGQDIQSGEGGNVNPAEYAARPVVAQPDGKDKVGDKSKGKSAADESGMAENDIEITAGADPLGLMETDKEASADDELMQLYADLDLPKTAMDEEEEMEMETDEEPAEEEVEEEPVEEEVEVEMEEETPKMAKAASKKTKLKPQPKKASTGAQRVGAVPGMSRQASTEIAELEKMWETAPDVAEVFGLPQGR